MSSVAKIEAAAWDRQIESDSNSGQLDFLLKELSEDIAQERMLSACEICGESAGKTDSI